MTAVVRIIAADDHQLFLEGLASLFLADQSLNFVASCNDGDALQSLVNQHGADVVLLDLSMPGPSTEQLIDWFGENFPDIQLIALTMFSNGRYAQELLQLGLSAYVLKDCAFDDLHLAIEEVMAGGQFLSAELMAAMRAGNEESSLTNRELEVLHGAANGLGNKEIARELNITERTARFHLSNCCVKLDANGRSHAVAKAVQLSMIKL